MSLIKNPPNGKPMQGTNVTNAKVTKVDRPQQTTRVTTVPARATHAGRGQTGTKD